MDIDGFDFDLKDLDSDFSVMALRMKFVLLDEKGDDLFYIDAMFSLWLLDGLSSKFFGDTKTLLDIAHQDKDKFMKTLESLSEGISTGGHFSECIGVDPFKIVEINKRYSAYTFEKLCYSGRVLREETLCT